MCALELKQKEADRLTDLVTFGPPRTNGGVGLVLRPGRVTITPAQIAEVKRLLKNGNPKTHIQLKTNLSDYHVNGVERGRYDYLLDDHTVELLENDGAMHFMWNRQAQITKEQYDKCKKMQADGIVDWIIEHQTGLTTYKQGRIRMGDYDEMCSGGIK